MKNNELTMFFLNGEYEKLFKGLENKSLIHDYNHIFSPLASASLNGFPTLFSEKNEIYAKQFFKILNKKINKEFIKNKDHLPVVVDVVGELIHSIFSDISTVSDIGGNFIAQKNINSIKLVTETCVEFNWLCAINNIKNNNDILPLCFLRFDQGKWEEGAKTILSYLVKKYQRCSDGEKKVFLASYYFKCLDHYLMWKEHKEYFESIKEIAKDVNKIEGGFDAYPELCLLIPDRTNSYLMNEKDFIIIIEEMIKNKIHIKKIGGSKFWLSNLSVTKYFVIKSERKQVISFYEGIKKAIENKIIDMSIWEEEVREILRLCDNRFLYDDLQNTLENNFEENSKTKI